MFFKTRHNFLKRYFFLSAIIHWNNFDLTIRISRTLNLNIFRNSIFKFITPSANGVFNSHDPKAIEFITRLGLVQSHQNTNSNSFQDLLNPISICRLDIESSSCHLFHYPPLQYKKTYLLSTLKNIDNKLLDLTKRVLTKTLLFGGSSFIINTNTNILNVTVNLVYLLQDLTNRFFNEFTDCCRNEVINTKLNKSVSI